LGMIFSENRYTFFRIMLWSCTNSCRQRGYTSPVR